MPQWGVLAHHCPAHHLPWCLGQRFSVNTAQPQTYLGGLNRSHTRSPRSCSREWCNPLFVSVLGRCTRFGHIHSIPDTWYSTQLLGSLHWLLCTLQRMERRTHGNNPLSDEDWQDLLSSRLSDHGWHEAGEGLQPRKTQTTQQHAPEMSAWFACLRTCRSFAVPARGSKQTREGTYLLSLQGLLTSVVRKIALENHRGWHHMRKCLLIAGLI